MNGKNIILANLIGIIGKLYKNYNLFSNKFIKEFQNKINWDKLIIYNPNIYKNIIKKYENKINWTYVSIYQNLTDRFMIKYHKKLNIKCLTIYQQMSDKTLKKLNEY